MRKLDIDRLPTHGELIVGFFIGLLLFVLATAASYGLYRLMLTRGALLVLIVLLALAVTVGVYATSLMWRTLLGHVRKSGGIGLWLLGSLMSTLAVFAAISWWASDNIRFLGYAVSAAAFGIACFQRAWHRRNIAP